MYSPDFDSKIIHFYTSYFPYGMQNGIWSSKSNGKNNKSEYYNFLIICRYLNLVNCEKSEDDSIENRKFTSCYNILNRLWGKYILFSLNFAWKRTLLPAWKGYISSKIYNSRIKVWQEYENGLLDHKHLIISYKFYIQCTSK